MYLCLLQGTAVNQHSVAELFSLINNHNHNHNQSGDQQALFGAGGKAKRNLRKMLEQYFEEDEYIEAGYIEDERSNRQVK